MRVLSIALFLLSSSIVFASEPLHFQHMRGFPNQERGYEKGVSACYAGCIDGYLIMAGGCNFPDTPVAQGGKKKYYRGIYAAKISSDTILQWKRVGNLPEEAAYGVAISVSNGLICIGGSNNKTSIQSVLKIRWKRKGKEIVISSLPFLPYSLDNMTGAEAEGRIIVAGGNCNNRPSNKVFCLNMKKQVEGWKELPSFPGIARVQPVSACLLEDGSLYFYLLGGFQPHQGNQKAILSLNALRYSLTSNKWERTLAPIDKDGESVFLGGAVAASLNKRSIICMVTVSALAYK